MRIIVHGPKSPGRHDARIRAESQATYQLQRGAARVALDHQRVRPALDAYGTPLPLATGLAAGYSEKALERMARGGSIIVGTKTARVRNVMSNADRRRLGLPLDPALTP